MGGADRVKAFPPGRGPAERAEGGDAGGGRRLDRWLAAPLFLATLFSVLVAGALLGGVDPLAVEFRFLGGIPFWWPSGFDPGAILSGAAFALPFLAILGAHEWAHRAAARVHGVRVSLPFFIPFPPHLSVVGTLGAFIRIRSRVPSRQALLDIGLSGPLASFLLSLPALGAGLALSAPSQFGGRANLPFLIQFQEVPIRLGEPLVVRGIAWIFAPEAGGAALHLHPLAFAGWLGLVLTFLNLLPLARLDGGHILHALDPARQRWWARATVGIFLALGFVWTGWWVWAGVMAFLGRGRPLPHDLVPPDPPPSRARRVLAWCAMSGILLLLPPVPVGL
jgi:Zn-dependent protease